MQILYALRRRLRRVSRHVGGRLRGRILALAVLLVALFALHVVAMLAFEGLSLGEAAWLTATTATTVGYGDVSAVTTAGRVATVVLMYVGGIFVLAQLAGLAFEATQLRLDRQRYGRVSLDLHDHVIIVGWRADYVPAVIDELRGSRASIGRADVAIVSPTLEVLPEGVDTHDVHFVNGPLHLDDTLRRASVAGARAVAILPEECGGSEEAPGLELVLRVRALAPEATVIYAASDGASAQLAHALGAAATFALDPNYPDACARSLIAPGSVELVTDLLDRDGARIQLLEGPLECTVDELVEALGGEASLLGLYAADGHYRLHPSPATAVRGEALVLLFDPGRASAEVLRKRLAGLHGQVEPVRTPHPRRVGMIGSPARLTDGLRRAITDELSEVEVEAIGSGQEVLRGAVGEETLAGFDTLVVLSERPGVAAGDALAHLAVAQLRGDSNFTGRIVAEAVSRAGRVRLRAAGADDVLRPTTGQPHLLARCIATGAEELVDALYGSHADVELLRERVTVDEPWDVFAQRTYGEGVALAFAAGGELTVLPEGDRVCGSGWVYRVVGG